MIGDARLDKELEQMGEDDIDLDIPNVACAGAPDPALGGADGARLVLACDILGWLIRYPYEVPVGTVFGVVGSALFLYLLLHGPRRAA